MLFLETMFCGSDLALSPTPTFVDKITYVELKNGMYDDLYITKDVESEPTNIVPEEWDFNTILHATFNDTTNAGNVNWSTSTVSHLLIKRRINGEFNWKTINIKEINSIEDFKITGIDYTNASHVTYDYAVVPTLYGAENDYSIISVESIFSGIFLVEKDKIYGTQITDGYCDTTRNFPSSTVVTINNRKPTDIRTSIANYDSGTCSGNWITVSEEGCELEIEDKIRIPFQRELIDFLSDGYPKLLKHFDGRIWLVKIEDQITDSADTAYNNRKLTFSWTEIGDYKSEEDMYYANLSDVTEEWWSL